MKCSGATPDPCEDERSTQGWMETWMKGSVDAGRNHKLIWTVTMTRMACSLAMNTMGHFRKSEKAEFMLRMARGLPLLWQEEKEIMRIACAQSLQPGHDFGT
eukprot:1159253-Pelagomonas_calceolata.AAC.4